MTDDLFGWDHGAMVLAGITDEKASATRALGTYALATGRAYMPYLPSALEAIKQSTGYFHEDVREQAYLALPGLLHAVQGSSAAASGAPYKSIPADLGLQAIGG